MGHKSVVIFDHDSLHQLKEDPAEFVRRLELAILGHRQHGGSVSIGGATVANVVWSGHADLSPVLEIVDFQAKNVTYDAHELRDLGFQLEAEKAPELPKLTAGAKSAEEIVRRIVSYQLGLEPGDLDLDRTFDDLGADSLDRVELVILIEDELTIEIRDEDVAEIETSRQAIQYLEGRLNGRDVQR